MSGINVLSLFDGISCGQIALQRSGIKVNKYYASEIDQHAIKVTQHNWPDTIQLGDVTEVKSEDLPKIDLLIGGSPCQGFSFAGKQLNFEDPRSKLFFEYTRLLRECKPSFFLLENVKMKKESEKVISEYLGVEPIEINSALVSAQNRRRLYWTNIPNVDQPEDKGFYVKDILDNDVHEKHYLCNCYKLNLLNGGESRLNVLNQNYRKSHKEKQDKPVLVSEVTGDTPSGRSRQTDRLYSSLSKSPTLLANRACDLKIDNGSGEKLKWRTLTSTECERLQTVPEKYTSCIPDPQKFKCLGNGWTVDVIAHIFKSLSKELAE